MNGIKFNAATKEIEIKGSMSFMKSHFDMIENLLCDSFGIKTAKVSAEIKAHEEPVLWVEAIEPQAAEATVAVKAPEVINVHEGLPAVKSNIIEKPQAHIAKRPPVRKYFAAPGKLIKVEGTGITKDTTGSVEGEKLAEISIESLMKKFGLSESKIGGIIRDAEKHGKVRRAQNGFYEWA